MKLTYRGTNYDYVPPTVAYGDAIASGKYRGLDIRFRNPKKVPVFQTTLDLNYRGASSKTVAQETSSDGGYDVPASALVSKMTASVDHLARTLMMNESKSVKQRQQDMLSRLANEVGLNADDVAQNWSRIQGKLHPTFRSNYSRSGAAMS